MDPIKRPTDTPVARTISQAATARPGGASELLQSHKVLRNTYMLLSMTLLFSAACAGAAIMLNAPPLHWVLTLAVYFGLLFAVTKTQNSAMGLVMVFALTGFLGFTLGPMLNAYLTFVPNGSELVMMALGGTGAVFVGVSGYVLATGNRYSHWGAALTIGILMAFFGSIAMMFFNVPALSLAFSALWIILMSGLIMYQTGEIIHGGETNYISATVTLFVALFNMFVNLLHLLTAFAGDE